MITLSAFLAVLIAFSVFQGFMGHSLEFYLNDRKKDPEASGRLVKTAVLIGLGVIVVLLSILLIDCHTTESANPLVRLVQALSIWALCLNCQAQGRKMRRLSRAFFTANRARLFVIRLVVLALFTVVVLL